MSAERRILITGSSRGIGRAIAVTLARAGFAVTLNGRSDSPALGDAVREIEDLGGQVNTLVADVQDRSTIARLIEEDVEAHGAYWGVVVNAGLHRDAAFPSLTDEDWDQVLGVNLDGFYNVVKPSVMPMIRLRSGGRIIAISSVSGIMGNRGQVNYSAAKAGLIGAARALAVELAKRRISVNCVAPGIIESEMSDAVPDEFVREMVPMRRRGRDSEVAALVGFLMSEEAEYITRQVISINGGMA
jgi:3-oxoacyl-[acyl-carrier protein] reductase